MLGIRKHTYPPPNMPHDGEALVITYKESVAHSVITDVSLLLYSQALAFNPSAGVKLRVSG
jgi:hypothetical protein